MKTYLLYVDKSGAYEYPSTKSKTTTKHLVLGATAIEICQVPTVQKTINYVLSKWGINTNFYKEVKWEDISRAYGAGIKRVPCFADSRVETISDLRQFFNDMLLSISGINDIHFLASVSNRHTCFGKSYISKETDLVLYTYIHLVERFAYLLRDIKRVTSDQHVYGIVFLDHDDKKYEEALIDAHRTRIQRGKTYFTSFPEIVEMLSFLPSQDSAGIQVADYIAGAVFRYFEKTHDTWLKLLLPRFRSKSFPNQPQSITDVMGYGIKYFT